MNKRKMMKRGLSLLLALVMVLGYIPAAAPHVHAASNLEGGLEGQSADVFSALGFDTSVMPEGYDAETVDNPYGRTKVTGTQIWEALVSAENGVAAMGAGNGTDGNDLGASSVVNAGVSGSMPMTMFAAAPADFDNDGLQGEAVYVGYSSMPTPESVIKKLNLYTYDAKSGTFSDALDLGYVSCGNLHGYNEYMDETEDITYMYAAQNMLQITSGDYDGDGIYEIAVYIADSDKARVDIYKWMKTEDSGASDWMTMSNWSVVWSYALSGSDAPNMVSLHSTDINQDGIDDLAIAYGEVRDNLDYYQGGLNFTRNDTATKSSAVILWGDRNKMLQNKYSLNLEAAGLGDLARVSITTGDLDGDAYNELVVTGQPLSDVFKNTARSVIVYTYDGTGGLTKISADTFKIVDGYYSEGSWVANNGFDQYYNSSSNMKTNAAVFRPEGYDNTFLYLDSCLFEYIEGVLTLKMCLDEEKYDGINTLNNTWLSEEEYMEYGAVAMDINGDGYQQLFASYYTADTGFFSSSYENRLPTYSYKVNAGLSGLQGSDGAIKAYTKQQSYYVEKAEYFGVLEWAGAEHTYCNYVIAVNCDKDTTILEYTGRHWLTYQDPKILAVVAAAPYFEDVDVISDYDYAWQNTTSWSKIEGGGHGTTVQVDLEAGAYVSQGSKFNEAEIAALFTMEWSKDTTESTEYTLTFETSQDEDAVAFFSIPTEHYEYTIYQPNSKGEYESDYYVVSRPFQAVYQVLNLDYYESIRGDYENLPAIRDEILTSTPGDPGSYPSSTSGYDVISQWNDDPAGISFGNGAITQEITVTKEESESYNLGAAVDTTIGGGYDGTFASIMAGITFSINPSGGWMDFEISGTTISGTVTNMPLEFQDYGYYYNWALFSYAAEMDGNTFPVVSYLVNDVSEPPRLPKDFQQDVGRTTADKNVLTWTYDGNYSKFIVYKYFDFPVGGGLEKVAEYAAGETPYTLKYDENGNPYKEFYFEDTNLAPYSEYQYAIQVERLDEIPPLSSPSGLLTARTKAADGNPVLSITESDGNNDGIAQIYPDKNAYLIAQVTGPDGEKGSAYYSTIQYQWQKRNDQGKWEDMVNETNQTLTIASAGSSSSGAYRCRVNVLTKKDNTGITAYTDQVELVHSKRTSQITEVYATDLAGNVKLYAKVVNAHTDSATVPDGYVSFNLINTATGDSYPVNVALDSSGVASAVSTNTLPAGQYRIVATYSGSYIFKSSTAENYYLSQKDGGYAIDAPESVIYGNSCEVFFNQVTKTGGVTQAKTVDAKSIVIRSYKLVQSERGLDVAQGQTPTEEQLNGAILIEDGAQVTEGQKYCTYIRASGAPVGGYIVFTAEATGTYKANYFLGWNGYNIFRNVILFDRELIKGTDTGTYKLPDDVPVNTYDFPLEYVIVATAVDGTVVEHEISVKPRPITLQLPVLVEKQDNNRNFSNAKFKDLTVVSGGWAACDCDGEGNLLIEAEAELTFTNTAGAKHSAADFMEICGYYTVTSASGLDNYQISYLPGSVSVIGGNKPVTFGVRPFEGQSVGTLYMVSPDYAYTRENKGITMNQAVGSRVIFTAVPDDGYQIYDWYVDGVAQGKNDSTFAYVMTNQDTVVEVQFVFKSDTLVYGISGDVEGGTLVCSDSNLTSGSIVIPNTYVTFTAQAKEGYHFKEWRYTELGRGTAYYSEDDGKMSSAFELLMPKNSCSVYAVFARDGYTLTYSDKHGLDGLIAWYWGSTSGDTTAQLEKLTVASGDTVPGDTEIVIQAKEGFELDADYNFVSTGSQGIADYQNGTYTLVLTEDTEVSAYTVQHDFDVTVAFDIDTAYRFCDGAKVTLTVDGTEYIYDCPQDDQTFSVSDISGGSKVSVAVTYPSYYTFNGWNVNGTVQKNQLYTVSRLGQDTIFTLKLKENPVYKVTLADISGKGSYSVTLPEGAGQSGNVVTCHENDPLTIQVIPEKGNTVIYWNVESADAENSWETKASSLKYQFPQLTADYTFKPIFSGSTYHTVTWPTLRYYGVTLTPVEGYLATVASGSEFKFTLSGGEDQYEYVAVNGRAFYESAVDYPYTYQNVNGVRVYTIHNITGDQVITISAEEPVCGVNLLPDTADVPVGKSIVLTAETYGDANFDVYSWYYNDTLLQQGPSNKLTFTVPETLKPGNAISVSVKVGNSDNGENSVVASNYSIIRVSDAVNSITVSCDDLTASEDGSYRIHPITPTNTVGTYDFDGLVTMASGASGNDVDWRLWGAQMRGTFVDEEGILTVSPKEYGTNGQLKLIAIYTYSNGDTDTQEVIINLSTDAYVVSMIDGAEHGTVSTLEYVEGGSTVTVTATPDENHSVECWYLDGVAVADNTSNELTFTAEEMTYYTVVVKFTHYYPDAKQDETNHWYECSCGDRSEVQEHYDFDKNHFCDKCQYRMTECTDEDRNHFCDWCGERTSECVDEVKDHICDWCSETLTVCTDKDTDHICDWCSEKISECADDNNNHFCDYCKEKLTECKDSSLDHNCDVCGRELTKCVDGNMDHLCDICSIPLSKCQDEDRNHNCDICGEAVSDCVDENNDHNCDYCGIEDISECADQDPEDHKCDTCGEVMTDCADDDHDHLCNICGERVSDCADEEPADHKCDICGEVLSDCADEDRDHKCDICTMELSICADDDLNHRCDICNKVISPCADIVDSESGLADHYCDVCGKHLSSCMDNDGDNICDICGKELNAHDCADGNQDHLCDNCGKELSQCLDEAPKDHKCDICGKELSQCLDEDGDHNCDVCGKEQSNCVDTDPADHVCDICKNPLGECGDEVPADHKCDVCGKDLSDCADTEPADHICDICGVGLGECTDEDPADHMCDICKKILSACKDEADAETGLADHKCDVCGETVSSCVDEDRNHNCDICGKELTTCIDENHDHNCDVCGTSVSVCKDEANEETGHADHFCDICGEITDTCKDEADEETGFVDHMCDICGLVLSQCTDADPEDLICDLCGKDMHECVDEETDENGFRDHLCDHCGFKLTDCLDEETDEQGNTDHICDICGGENSLCVDEETDENGFLDHLCDICGKPVSECTDSDDHMCDICGEKVSECVDADHNDSCDICGEKTNAHIDEDRNHRCDVCYVPLSECNDGNNDHLCDYCSIVWSTCVDKDKDHACDICGAAVGTHAETADSHICEYCGKSAGECRDDDRNHMCDICGETLSDCADIEPMDHKCDICETEMSVCSDEADKNHFCDICGTELSQCADEEADADGFRDHKCDYCGAEISVCVDENNDHACDICGATLTVCLDEIKDHLCDICGDKLSDCADENDDHCCDHCGETLSECSDSNDDHLCDLCGEPVTETVDKDRDHICDICGETVSDCADSNSDHICDTCGRFLGQCPDEDKDHKCDVCGDVLSECADENNDHICDYCEKVVSKCADEDKDHKCDICGEEISSCADEDKDHKCDTCGETLSECLDEDADHECDICGETLSECLDEDKDHNCDICGKELSQCTDEDGNCVCDHCSAHLDGIIRVFGANRFKTAFKVADELKQTLGVEKFNSVIIASGTNFADALSGSYLAAVKQAPMLLTLGDTMNAELHAYIEASLVKGGTVYILGGANAVPETLDVMMEGYHVVRLAGENRFETNLMVLNAAGVKSGDEVLVCTSTNFADSLSASATGKPILLVWNEKGMLTEDQKTYLQSLDNCSFTVIGGENAIGNELAEMIGAYGKVSRLSGKNRFETSVLVAQKYFAETDAAVLAYAWSFPDGLCGGSLAYAMKAPLILTMTDYEAQAAEYIRSGNIGQGIVLGGEKLISDGAVRNVFAMEEDGKILVK